MNRRVSAVVKRTVVPLHGETGATWYAPQLHCSCGEVFSGACDEVAFDRFTKHATGKDPRTSEARIIRDGIALRRKLRAEVQQ